jgi:adenine-specific DNA-methyltransferase
VSIDDNELHHVRMLMNEVFGVHRWIATFAWKRRQTPDSRNVNGVSGDIEYIVCFGRSGTVRFKGDAKDMTKYANVDGDPQGPWMSDNLTGLANATERPNLHYVVVNPTTGREYPPHPSRGWIYGQERMKRLIADGRILWPTRPNGRPRLKRFASDMKAETTGFSTLLDAPANVAGTKELAAILGKKVFAFPKPVDLIRQFVEQVTCQDDLVLDSFAGSGTTGQAVLEQNRRDGGQRRFVLVEIDETVSTTITAERLTRVIHGYVPALGRPDPESVRGLGGGYRFCSLAQPLFDETGGIRDGVTFAELSQHIYFTETGLPLPTPANGTTPLLGVHDDEAVYLLYNGVLGDRRPDGGNVLTSAVLAALPPHEGPRVIYGEGCRLGAARLARERITFKQTPYDVRVG